MAGLPNLLRNIPACLGAEVTETLAQAQSVRIERIVSRGHASPPDFWYEQAEHEFVLLMQGAARLRFEDRVEELKAGDWLNIPAHQKHRVEWTMPNEDTVWLVVFYD
jgi:cupin 2 domain-containing protein